MKKSKIITTARFIICILLLQTLYFKFTAAPESVYIFTKLGIEPYGRIVIGILELITVILLFIRNGYFYGAILSFGLIAGALFSHLTVLGIEVQNDGGTLFILALIAFICATLILSLEKNKFLYLLKK